MVGGHYGNGRDDRRRLERRASRGDLEVQVRALAERVSRGDVSRSQVALAAALGEPRARRLAPGESEVDWSRWRVVRDVTEAVGRAISDEKGLAVAFGLDCVDRMADRNQDKRVVAALDATRRWLMERSQAALRAVLASVREADSARLEAWAITERIGHERAAGRAASLDVRDQEDRAASVTAFVATAALSLASAIRSRRPAFHVANALLNVVSAYFPDQGRKADERDWQRARLAAYALGEVKVPGPRANPDRRRLERRASRGDLEAQVRALAERVSRSELSVERVRVAAALGDPRARRLDPQRPYDWSEHADRVTALQSASLVTGCRIMPIAFAADCASRVVHLCQDPRADAALEAARRWLLEPSMEAIRAAHAAACAATSGGGIVSRSSWSLAFRAAASAAAAVAYAPLHPIRYVADAAGDACKAAEDEEAEEAWQRARLAAYVLGEIEVAGPRTNPRKDDQRRKERAISRAKAFVLSDPEVRLVHQAIDAMHEDVHRSGGILPDVSDEFRVASEILGVQLGRGSAALDEAMNRVYELEQAGATPERISKAIEAMKTETSPNRIAALQHDLEKVLPARRQAIISAAVTELSSDVQAFLETALDIALKAAIVAGKAFVAGRI